MNRKQSIYNYIKKNKGRILLFLCLVGGIFVAPLLSEARYKASLNGFTAIIAKEYYFASNYLKEEEADYTVNGWDGKNHHIGKVQIQNYANTLQANQEGQDLNYELTWDVKIYNENGEVASNYNYGLKVTLPKTTATDEAPNFDGEGTEKDEPGERNASSGKITGTLIGDGSSKSHDFDITLVNLGDSNTLPPDDFYVEIRFSAVNGGGDRNQYYRKMDALMTYYVSHDENLVSDFFLEKVGSKDDLSVTIYTNYVSGITSGQTVILWWDREALSVNFFNYHFNKLYLAEKYETVEYNGRKLGVLYITASSLSNSSFEFTNRTEIERDALVSEEGQAKYLVKQKKYEEVYTTGNEEVYMGYYTMSNSNEGTVE